MDPATLIEKLPLAKLTALAMFVGASYIMFVLIIFRCLKIIDGAFEKLSRIAEVKK